MFINLRIRLKQIFAPCLRISRDDHSPILFEDYEESSYYYILNNNKSNIYTLHETYELLKKEDPIDPTTRCKIYNVRIVKVRFNR